MNKQQINPLCIFLNSQLHANPGNNFSVNQTNNMQQQYQGQPNQIFSLAGQGPPPQQPIHEHSNQFFNAMNQPKPQAGNMTGWNGGAPQQQYVNAPPPMHQPQHQVGNITGLNGGTPQQQYANAPWHTGNMPMNTDPPMVLHYTRGPTVMSQHPTRINNVADQNSIEYKKKAVELLNQQLQHKF